MTGNEGPAGRVPGRTTDGLPPTVQGAAVPGSVLPETAVPGSFDAGWHDEREDGGRPFWAVPLILSFWAIAVPLGLSLWFDDDVEAAPASCIELALGLDAALRAADAGAAARLGHDLGRAGCPLPSGH
ncbi:hypothetical protein ACFOGJ_22485 [Marinibaculum pumilum]|uniref:Uncharacterized protein n=1 Tax=Marinibaculum pumilum TaxID=1766165 RepID=A0ABV7L5U6_9PROT